MVQKLLLSFLLLVLLVACSNETIKVSFSQTDCQINWSLCSLFPNSTSVSIPNNPVKVAILDSGIDNTHPFLKKRIVKSFDATQKINITKDKFGHGTAIAGIIGASSNKQTIQGISPNVEIYDVKVLNDKGGGEIKNVVNGIKWSVKQDVDILNLSFGFQKNDPTLKQAIDYAVDNNIIVIAAAGNTLGFSTDYPAKYKNVISISSVNKHMKRDKFAAKGKIDFVAPGVDIPVLTPTKKVNTVSGTSFSAAYASGILANILARNPNIQNYDDVLAELKASSKDLGEKGLDNEYGNGLIQFE